MENALDIVDDTEEKSCKLAGDIMETLSCKFQDLKLSENVNCSEVQLCQRSLKGLGDQLKADEYASSEEPVQHPPVEKKNRLTDLVKNSKQVLSKLILNDSNNHGLVKHEKVLRVVNLDSKKGKYKVKQTIKPETVPLPPSDSDEMLNQMNENTEQKLDEVELADATFKTNVEEIRAKTMTFPLAGPSNSSPSLLRRYRTLKFATDLKQKKWNIGSKIINYIKKKGQNRRSDESLEKATTGIEIIPNETDQ